VNTPARASEPPAPESWTHVGYAQRIVFGPGRLTEIGELLRSLGVTRPLLVTTKGRGASDDGERLRAAAGLTVTVFDGVEPHVPKPRVVEAAALGDAGDIDGIVSFGGGSCADLGKAIAHQRLMHGRAPAPHVAVPTTYSGAELTPFYGVTDPVTRVKAGGGHPSVAPQTVLYDPELTLGTPLSVTAETSLNAMAHCVEALWATERSPEAIAIAEAGATAIARALPAVVDAPTDLPARSALLTGAALAGRALQNAAMGVHHGLAQQVGARTGIAHGLANSLLLPHTIRFNAAGCPGAMQALRRAWGTDDPAGFVADLLARAGLPTRLSDAGVEDADLVAIAETAPTNRNVSRNPVPVDEAAALAILRAAF
jgi:alcohol dehydrogenase class IV